MCLLLSFGCCGCSSPKPKPKRVYKLQEKSPNGLSSDTQLQEWLRPDPRMAISQPSLPSMSPSMMALPHRIHTSSTLSSWACEEELYDMEEYDEQIGPTKWTSWWFNGSVSSDQILATHSSVID